MHHLKSIKDSYNRATHQGSKAAPLIAPTNASGPSDIPPALLATKQQAIDVFLFFKEDNGEIAGIGYWQAANGYTAIVLHDLWSGSNHNAGVMSDLLARVEHHYPGYVNEFNDDTLWWAHCLLQFFRLTHDPVYLSKAVAIQQHVSRSVIPKGRHRVRGQDMEGAVLWTTKSGEDSLNTITTGLYAELCALLATVPIDGHTMPALPRKQLLEAAKASFGWIVRCRFRDQDSIVLDTIHLKTGETVDWTFTYTTGQLIATCAALYTVTGDDTFISLAKRMAIMSMRRPDWVDSNGVLTEAGAYGINNHEAWQNDDAVGFKSVLMRSLAKLYRLLHQHDLELDLQQQIRTFIQRTFDSLCERDTNGKGQYGPWWNGPFDTPTSHSQLAVLDVMAAIGTV